MAWHDDYFTAANATDTSSVNAGINTYYDKKFLRFLKENLQLANFAQKRPLPEGNGTSVEFMRWLALSADPSSFTLTEGVNPGATQINNQKVSATIAEYGAFAQLSSLIKQSHIDRNVSGASEIFGEHAANLIENLCQRELAANGAHALRADLDSSFVYEGTLTAVTSTTVFADDQVPVNQTNAADYLNGDNDANQSVITFTSGRCQGMQRAVTDFTASSGQFTVGTAFEQAPEVGDTYIITGPEGTISGDDLSWSNVKAARAWLKKKLARPLKGGYYVAVIDPDSAKELMDDSKWTDVQSYQGSGIYTGEIGKFAGVRFIEHTNPFYFPIASLGTDSTSNGPGDNGGNQSLTDTGTSTYVVSNFILGQDAFGVSAFQKKINRAIKPGIIAKNPGPNDTSNPLNRYGTVGWAMELAFKALHSHHAVQIWCTT